MCFATEPSGVMAEQPTDEDLVDRFVDFVRQFVGFHCFFGRVAAELPLAAPF
jgi:hypothetical protein